MAFRKERVALQFSGGIETKQDGKQVPATKLLALENATFIKATTLAKRNGHERLGQQVDTTGAIITGTRGLAARGDELLLLTESRCYSHRPSLDDWSDAGELATTVVTDRPLARTGTAQTMPDVATNNGITVAAWEDSRGGVWCSVIEEDGRRVVLADVQLDSGGSSPRCVAVGAVVHVLWANAAQGRIWVAIVNPATPETTPTPIILTEDLSKTNAVYDACTAAGGLYDSNPALIAWSANTPPDSYRVGYIDPSGALGGALYGLPPVATFAQPTILGPVAITYDKASHTKVGVMFSLVDDAHVQILSSSSLTTSAYTGSVTTITAGKTIGQITCEFADAITDLSGNTTGTLWWAVADQFKDTVQCGAVDTAGAVVRSPSGRVLRGHRLLSRAFYDAGQIYAAVVHPVPFFPYVAVVRLSAADFGGAKTIAVARMLPGTSTGSPSRAHLASVSAVSPDANGLSRQHRIALGVRLQLSSANNDQYGEAGIREATIDFDASGAGQSAQLGLGLYLAAGGFILHYDGRRWAEADFHCAPDSGAGSTLGGTDLGAATGSMAAGTYEYKVAYEEIDAQGEIHRGPTCVPFNVVVAAGTSSVSITAPTYRLSAKTRVRIGVFRSPKNQTGEPDTIPFYRVTSTDPNAGGANGFLLNDPTVDSVAFTDGMSDADLITKEPLYTNGGILSNAPAPMSGAVIAGGKSRLYWTDPSDPHLVRYSQEIADDTAIEAPIDLSLRTDPYGGAVIGISVMDDAVYVLKETAVQVFAGPGPDRDGGKTSQNAFSGAELVTSDVGCKSPGSIVQTPLGIMFQSQKGIMLLERGRQTVRVGSPVYAYNAQTFVRATLLPDRPQIVFLTNSGSTLLYDYERDQWSTFTNHEGADAVLIDGVYHYLRNDGRVFRETASAYRDDGSHIKLRIETAWIKMSGALQDWQKVIHALIVGAWKSAHTLRVRYRLDYEDSYSAPIDIDTDSVHTPASYGSGAYGAGPYGGPPENYGGVYQHRIHLNRRCQAISFLIEDVEATDTYGAAFELSELHLTGAVIGPAFQPGAGRSH